MLWHTTLSALYTLYVTLFLSRKGIKMPSAFRFLTTRASTKLQSNIVVGIATPIPKCLPTLNGFIFFVALLLKTVCKVDKKRWIHSRAAGGSCNGRVKVLAQLIATVLGHGRCGKLASAPEMLAVVKRAASRVHGKTKTKKFKRNQQKQVKLVDTLHQALSPAPSNHFKFLQ